MFNTSKKKCRLLTRHPNELEYHFTVDVRCRTKDGHHFLVGMENDFRDDYQLKALIEHSSMLSQDTDQTEEDRNKRAEKNKRDATHFLKGIQGIYTIVITNKVFDFQRIKLTYLAEKTMEPLLVNPYELRHTEQLDRSYGDIPNRVVLLMLGHLNNKSVAELETTICTVCCYSIIALSRQAACRRSSKVLLPIIMKYNRRSSGVASIMAHSKLQQHSLICRSRPA